MLDIRLDDERDHQLVYAMERALLAAEKWERQGDQKAAEALLAVALGIEQELIAFRRKRIDDGIDWW